jgi:hypothetical protein
MISRIDKSAIPRMLPIVLLALIFGIYAAFATHSYYWDGVSFALAIENVYKTTAPFGALFHPNHLVYNLFGYWIFSGLQTLGVMTRALWVLQGINIVISVWCGYVVFRIAEYSFRSIAVAYYCWFLFAFGALWWEFSTNADAYIIATFCLVLGFFCIVTRGVRYLPIVCVVHVLAMIVHELSLFFLVPVILSLWLEPGITMRRRVFFSAAYCASAALLVASAYYFCFSLAPHAANSLLSWAGSHADDAHFTYSLKSGIVVNALSYIKLFLGGKFSSVYAYLSMPTLISLVAVAVGVAYSVVLFRRNKKTHYSDTVSNSEPSRRCFVLSISWVLPYVIFLSIWLPQNGFYKLMIWPPLVLLLGRCLSLRPRIISGAAALLVAMVGWNFAAYVYPRSHDSATPVVAFAKMMNAQLPRGTVIYYTSFVPDDWYLQYFTPRTEWRHLNASEPILVPQSTSPLHPRVCFETTALELLTAQAHESGNTFLLRLSSEYKWDLVSPKYNVRVQCAD